MKGYSTSDCTKLVGRAKQTSSPGHKSEVDEILDTDLELYFLLKEQTR